MPQLSKAIGMHDGLEAYEGMCKAFDSNIASGLLLHICEDKVLGTEGVLQ